VLWEYFYGRNDAERIKQTSIAITSATSGSAIYVFALYRQERGSYREAMNAFAVVAFALAGCDVVSLAKPELLEAIVRRAPTWEQLVARRQREGYFSLTGQLLRTRTGQFFRAIAAVARGTSTNAPATQANPIEVPPADGG